MHDALRVREAETIGGAHEELHHILERAALLTRGAPNRKFVRERSAFEPLEDHVRDEHARLRRLRRARGHAANDVEVSLRKPIQNSALVAEATDERFEELRR